MCPTTAPEREATRLAGPAAQHRDRSTDAEPVEVRVDGAGHLGQPGQLLWQDRLWLVRHALRLAAAPSTTTGQGASGECWRLLVGNGPAGPPMSVVVARAGDGWLLHRDA